MNRPLQRLPDWMIRLDALVREKAGHAYAWGESDCCTLAADCVVAITGQDPMADLRGTYDGEAAAQGVLTREGGLVAALTARLGPPVPVRMARPGDVGISGTAAVIHAGGGVWLGQADRGLVPVLAPRIVWRCDGV